MQGATLLSKKSILAPAHAKLPRCVRHGGGRWGRRGLDGCNSYANELHPTESLLSRLHRARIDFKWTASSSSSSSGGGGVSACPVRRSSRLPLLSPSRTRRRRRGGRAHVRTFPARRLCMCAATGEQCRSGLFSLRRLRCGLRIRLFSVLAGFRGNFL